MAYGDTGGPDQDSNENARLRHEELQRDLRNEKKRLQTNSSGCVVALVVMAGSVLSASYGVYQFCC